MNNLASNLTFNIYMANLSTADYAKVASSNPAKDIPFFPFHSGTAR